MSDEVKQWIADEVARRMATVTAFVANTEEKIAGQNRLLSMQVQRIQRLEETIRALFSNGSGGPPGYMEVMHAENSQKMLRIEEKLEEVCEQIDRERGKDELLAQQKQERIDELKLADDLKTSRMERFKHYAQIASVFGGAWLLNMIPRILHALASLIAQH